VRVLPATAIRRDYWLVIHESARALAPIRAAADFIAETVERERALFG